MSKDDKEITHNSTDQECEACKKWKPCKMYLTMVGAVWVCKECRTGKS